jgi:hypothetical protein
MESSAVDFRRIDYSSVIHGGRVVSSLKDGLPLLNRLAAFWMLRFYGHGPLMALTPLPSRGGGLGQCWSFAGDTGYLTIQLGRRIQVQSVVVDHISPPSQMVSPRPPSVTFGFMDSSRQTTLVMVVYVLIWGHLNLITSKPTAGAWNFQF